ncbi:MAG: hypothetical protein WCF10_04215 [Polyangiales bacterium]
MRLLSALLLTSSLLCTAAPARRAVAQEETEDTVEIPAGEGSKDETEVIEEGVEPAERDTLAYNAAIMDEVLRLSTEQTLKEQRFAAAAGVSGGAILIGLGTWRLAQDSPQSQYSRGLGVTFMTLGMANLATGIFAAIRTPHEQRRLIRWERARKDGITDAELAHFEGELQASYEVRQGERLLVRWDAVMHAVAGAVVLALTPIPGTTSKTDRVSGYVVGGLFMAVGLGALGASFRKTPSEKAWESYNQRRLTMPGHELSWGVAPSISRRGAGLSVGGRF